MRPILIAAAAAALATSAAAQAPDPAKVRAAYEQLCTGEAPGSLATCAALRREVEAAGVPGTVGWSGILVGAPDDGTKAVRVLALNPDGPAGKAGVRTGDLLVAVDGKPFSDVAGFMKQARTWRGGQLVNVRIVRGTQILDLPMSLSERPKPAPVLNSQRTERGGYSLLKRLNGLSGAALTIDRIRIGEDFYGILEDSDATSDWGKREDCLEVADAGGARNLAAFVTPNGAPMRIYAIQGQCAYGATATFVAGADGKKPFGINFATPAGGKTYLMVSGATSAQPYQVIVREQTPKETIAWREQVRQNEIAAQQQREADARAAADRRQMWGAAFQGLLIGATGGELPAMREDGSSPNMLDTLNTANAALARKNAESAARLNETIARAQAQGAQQRREQAARDEAAARTAQLAKTQAAARDRQTLTNVLGTSRATYEARLRDAVAKGDKAGAQFYADKIRGVNETAQQYGIADDVRLTAERKVGQGQLGQTPIGSTPAPILASNSRTPPPAVAADAQRVGKAELGCHDHAGSESPFQCQEVGRGKSGSGQGSSGSGQSSSSGKSSGSGSGSGSQVAQGGGTAPGVRPPGGGSPPGVGQAVVEYETRPESITLCRLAGPQAQFNNWTCTGSLQMNYVNFEKPNWQAALHMTCGGKQPMRDLGTAGGYRAFGCGFPLPISDDGDGADIPQRFGVSYIPGRISYRCPKGSTRNCQKA